jgi:hypothetical protein
LLPQENVKSKLTVEMFEVVLFGSDVVLDDESVGPGEIGHGAGVKFAAWKTTATFYFNFLKDSNNYHT